MSFEKVHYEANGTKIEYTEYVIKFTFKSGTANCSSRATNYADNRNLKNGICPVFPERVTHI